jgi:DNA (cytosine-5)-methyltransferase 1
MKIGSLFSGIGGLELGLEAAGLGHTVWQVEKNPFSAAVLEKHWPGVPQYDDVHEVGAHNLEQVDLICGGFPCQDVSVAGLRAGLSGSRSGLWAEYLRVVDELGPEWVVVENVASGADLWVDAVTGALAESGYATLPIPLSAADVGAPHARARIFVVGRCAARRASAYAYHAQEPEFSGLDEVAGEPPAAGLAWPWSTEPGLHGVDARLSDRVDISARTQALGNAVVPQCAAVVGWIIRELLEKKHQTLQFVWSNSAQD